MSNEKLDISVREVFTEIFRDQGVHNPIEASCYYISLVRSNTPVSFTDIRKRSESELGIILPTVTTTTARDSLFDKGYLARVVFKRGFGQEAYIPVNPGVLWTLEKENIRSWYNTDYDRREKISEEHLFKVFDEKYGIYGLRIPVIGGDMCTIIYRLSWALSFLLQFNGKQIEMWLSGMRVFNDPLSKYLKLMLERGCKIKAIVERRDKVEIIKQFVEKNRGIEIKFLPLEDPGTHRRFIVGDDHNLETFKADLCFDSLKILPLESDMYIGTIYFDNKSRMDLTKNFEAIWKKGKHAKDVEG